MRKINRSFAEVCSVGLLLLLVSCQDVTENPVQGRWWKGNLHTHSLWSDGDDYPEMIMQWYKERGYHFVALSDHNILAKGEKWVAPMISRGGMEAFDRYLAEYGSSWVESETIDDTLWTRLKTIDEYRTLFEASDSFLVIQSEELSDGFEGRPVHVNATNILKLIEPQHGNSMRDVLQRNVDAVFAQRDSSGVPMFPHINHPNFGWAMTAEDLIALRGEQFFEVYNGHPAVHNYGEGKRPSMERIWDIILTRRLLNDLPLMYGMAVDDSHNYHDFDIEHSNPGRAWVMVRADRLSAPAIVEAMERGDFYASTGVELNSISNEAERLQIQISPENGVTYETFFIGTRVGHDSTSTPVMLEDGRYVTRLYSDEVGEVFERVKGESPSYTFQGNELYVRAKIVSSKSKENPYKENETEVAWTQPVSSP